MLLTAMDLGLPMEKRKKAAVDLMKDVGTARFAELLVRWADRADLVALGFAAATWAALIVEEYARDFMGGFFGGKGKTETPPPAPTPPKDVAPIPPDPTRDENGEPLKTAVREDQDLI